MVEHFAARRLENVIEQYIQARSRRNNCVSTASAGKAILQVMPRIDISPHALDDLIAARAIAYGLSVHFDREPPAS